MLPAHLEQDDAKMRKHLDIREVPNVSPFRQLVKHNTCFFAEWPHIPNTTHFVVKGKFSAKVHDVLLPVSIKAFTKAYANWVNGTHAQVAFHIFTADIREFIMTGTTPAEWGAMFGEEDE
jgi:hypothetical protein